jgi:hypothetical protein
VRAREESSAIAAASRVTIEVTDQWYGRPLACQTRRIPQTSADCALPG